MSAARSSPVRSGRRAAKRRPAKKPVVDAVTSKTCTSCHEDKPAAAFLPTNFVADGLTDSCKVCTFADAERDRRERDLRREKFEAAQKAKPAPKGVVAKECRACGVAKVLVEYAKHGRSRDGHRHVCKSCDTAARAKRLASMSAADLAASHSKRLAQGNAAAKKWKGDNYASTLAQASVYQALKRGIIAKPSRCQVRRCTSKGPLEGHHYSYDNPLAVLWICRSHHKRLHAGKQIDIVVGLPPVLATIPHTTKSRKAS